MTSSPPPPASSVDTEGSTGALPEQKSLRRSSRRSERPSTYDESKFPTTSSASGSITPVSQSAKRKARRSSEATPELRPNALEEALAPLEPQDIQDWEGWIELESEPDFFNVILRELGVYDVVAKEIFTLTSSSHLASFPKPIHGLIFLFQFQPNMTEHENDADTSDVWFANQTTSNACATVALLNIVMNIPDICLGEELRDFKESTKDLGTALRGHELSKNQFIRTIHNSFTRRMDHLNADLALDNEISDAATKKRRINGKGKGRSKKAAEDSNFGFHFIAYVPVGDAVWELDGLKSKPSKIGPMPSDPNDWISIAQPRIEAVMAQYEDAQLMFNLLALCKSPLALSRQKYFRTVASLNYLKEQMMRQNDPAVNENSMLMKAARELSKAPEFGPEELDITSAEAPESFKAKVDDPEFTEHDAQALCLQLIDEANAVLRDYSVEKAEVEGGEDRVSMRKKDYGPALHKWVQKLAAKGVLEDIITTCS
ncbi:hypothetical protein B0I35DRAFT_174986 [Stachybotrys elegans]|uniref:Ubiquitin carboxyl-terminal hydrolase n=1 Tax=Stachybotrys elegans TaxID=80388 RepID=A0A8K0T1V8_9HYPO|nr:hypothetical protein B0I35DRAFT_174986 [Stachybotrys elegans]